MGFCQSCGIKNEPCEKKFFGKFSLSLCEKCYNDYNLSKDRVDKLSANRKIIKPTAKIGEEYGHSMSRKKEIKLIVCEKCGTVKAFGKECSNCIMIEHIKFDKKVYDSNPYDHKQFKHDIFKNKKREERILEYDSREEEFNNLKLSRKTRYNLYMLSRTWKNLRYKILSFNTTNCEVCGEAGRNIHHWKYPKYFGEEFFWQMSILCKYCHKYIHENMHKKVLEITGSDDQTAKKLIEQAIEEVKEKNL